MLIFDHLPITDLVKVAEMSPRCAEIILQHFIVGKYRFHEKPITILIDTIRALLGYKTVFDEYEFITKDVHQTVWVLERFGHIFSHIQYSVIHFGAPDSLKVFESVDKYAVNSVKEITIFGFDTTAMSNWTYSFDSNVTQIKFGSFVSDPIALNTLFPYMQHLTIGNIMQSIAQHFPYLTGFVSKSGFRDDFDPGMDEFIRLNPQLREFHTSIRKNETYISYVNEMLPNLESLAIDIFIENGRPVQGRNIHFKNVKSFKMRLISMEPVQSFQRSVCNLSFDHLESYKIQGDAYIDTADIIEMISMNQELTFFEAYQVYLSIEELIGLVQRLPKLEEISIECSIYASLAALFTANHKLNRINLNDCSDDVNVNTLENISSFGWRVVVHENAFNYFSFIRNNLKNNTRIFHFNEDFHRFCI